MKKVFAMYRLKPGVSIEEYKKWSVEVDQKITPFQPGVHRFEAYEIQGAEKGESPYMIVEDIDVDSWEDWQKVIKSDEMKEVMQAWPEYGDESTAVVIYGEKIK